MNVYGAATLFAILILLYYVISEVFTVLFRLIGLPEEKARFQVTSLLTACGFTTSESEMFLSTKSRRKLARVTMMFGFIFNITIVSAFINVFVSMKATEITAGITGLMIPIIAVICAFILSRIHAVRSRIDHLIEKAAGKLSGSGGVNRVLIMDQVGDGCIAQVTINTIPEALKGRILGESGIRSEYNLQILLLEHRHKKPELPEAVSVFEAGDRITVFGGYRDICRAFEAKEYFSDSGDDPDQ